METEPNTEMELGTGRRSRGTMLTAVLVLIAGGAGFGAFRMYGQATEARAERDKLIAVQKTNEDVQAKLAQCKTGLDAEKATRGQNEKLASEMAANLDATRAELDELRKEHVENGKRLEAFKAISEKLHKMIDAGKIQVTVRNGRMIVKLPAEVLFASGSAELSKDGQTHIAEIAGVLKQFPDRKFMVEGHTDNVPVGDKRFKDNWELSTARAVNVVEFLISKGMRPDRLVAAGQAEHAPLFSNAGEAGRRENRRIEIVLLPNIAELPKLPDAPPAAPAASAKAK
jgi:chemotaxis protein MotB